MWKTSFVLLWKLVMSVIPSIPRTYAGRCFLVAGFYELWPLNLGRTMTCRYARGRLLWRERCCTSVLTDTALKLQVSLCVIKQRWTHLRVQVKLHSNSTALCWLKQLISPNLNTVFRLYTFVNHAWPQRHRRWRVISESSRIFSIKQNFFRVA